MLLGYSIAAAWLAVITQPDHPLNPVPLPRSAATSVCGTQHPFPSLDNPRELGTVRWQRSFDEAVQVARRLDRPLLVLFQEVPGCSTCVHYGQRVLSHPLIVEAAESLFVPVAVYNNVEGADSLILESFEEPSWNNPVVRIINPDRLPLAPRLAEDYSLAGLATSMVAALKQQRREVPKYLDLLAAASRARRASLQKATFAMHCFWEGEAALGRLPGVVGTEPGFIDRHEVVAVEFDPSVLSYDQLLAQAVQLKCADQVFSHSPAQQQAAGKVLGRVVHPAPPAIRPDKQPKYYLAQTRLRHVPMTAAQRCRVNAAVGLHGRVDDYLSPRQIDLLKHIRADPDRPWPDALSRTEAELADAWQAAWKNVPGF